MVLQISVEKLICMVLQIIVKKQGTQNVNKNLPLGKIFLKIEKLWMFVVPNKEIILQKTHISTGEEIAPNWCRATIMNCVCERLLCRDLNSRDQNTKT